MTRVLPLAVLLSVAGVAQGQSWYPPQCCSVRDCRPVPESRIKVTPQGYRYTITGETVPFGRAMTTPPGAEEPYHICTINGLPETGIICLFAPGMGS